MFRSVQWRQDAWQLERKADVSLAEIRECAARIDRLPAPPGFLGPIIDLALDVEAACRRPASADTWSELVSRIELLTARKPIAARERELASRMRTSTRALGTFDAIRVTPPPSVDCATFPAIYQRKCRAYGARAITLQVAYVLSCRPEKRAEIFEMLENARVRAAQTVEVSTRESRWIAPLAIVASHLAHCLAPQVPSGLRDRLGALLSGPVDESDSSRPADCFCVLDDLAMGFRCAQW